MKLVYGLLATGAAAASMRSTASVQVRQLQSLVQSDADPVAIEDTLMSLLANDSGNTPELARFVTSIKQLLDTQMRPKIFENKENQQKLVDSAVAQFATCRSTLQDAQAKLQARQSAFPASAAAHTQCRQQQSTADTASKTCAASLATMTSTRDALCKDLQSLEGQSPTCTRNSGEAYRDYVARQNLFFANALSTYDQKKKACADATASAEAQRAQCSAQASNLANLKSKCDDLQSQMDSASCAISTDAQATCRASDSCYNQALSNYNGVVRTARIQEAGLKTEFEAVLRLGCLSDVFAVADGSRADAIAACKAADYAKEVAPLSLNYPAAPASPSCSVPSGLAGSAAYQQAQYNSLPANAPARQCTATCCTAAVSPSPVQTVVQDASLMWNTPNVLQTASAPFPFQANLAGQSFTFAVWLQKPRDASTGYRNSKNENFQTVLSTQNSPGGCSNSFHFALSDNMMYFGTYCQDCPANGISVPIDQWFHAAWVYDASAREQRMFINGNRVGGCGGKPAYQGPATLVLGADQRGSRTDTAGTNPWFGSMKSVAVYSRAFSDAEIAAAAAK